MLFWLMALTSAPLFLSFLFLLLFSGSDISYSPNPPRAFSHEIYVLGRVAQMFVPLASSGRIMCPRGSSVTQRLFQNASLALLQAPSLQRGAIKGAQLSAHQHLPSGQSPR